MILPKVRDPRFITQRRGGTLTDIEHYLLALWAAQCAEHVLHYFEDAYPEDMRPRIAIDKTISWSQKEIKTTESKIAAYNSNAAAKNAIGPAKLSALSAGQAAAVSHVPAHELGAAAYAIRAVMAASKEEEKEKNRIEELNWQRKQLPEKIRELVLDDQKNRNEICWNVFLP